MSFKLTEKANKILSFYLRAIEYDISFNDLYNILRQVQEKIGIQLTYRRQDMLNDFRILKGYAPIQERMKYVPLNKMISDALYIPSEKEKPYQYVTYFRVRVRNPVTMEEEEKFVAITHDATYRRIDLENEVKRMFWESQEAGESEPVDIISITPIKGFKFKKVTLW